MKGKVKQLKAKEGFTIIELIVVIATIGILVLLAMFAFNGYTEKARVAQIKNDVKVAEGLVAEYLIKDNSLPDTWSPSNPKNSVSDIYDTRGLVDEVDDGNYRLIPKGEFNTKLTGGFHANDSGKVYYEDDRQTESSPLTDDEIAELIDEGFIPVANADELQRINGSGKDDDGVPIFEEAIWGAGTDYEGVYTGTLGSKYIQVQDIDLSSYDNWLPIGVNPGSPFNGIYNGGNYLIDNLNIEENIGFYSAGLFGSINNGNVLISNIKMRNVNVDINSNSSMLIGDMGVTSETTLSIMNIDIEGNVSGDKSLGGLIGFARLGAIEIIKDITIKGDISSTGDYGSAGGIIGQSHIDINIIKNITVEGDISSASSSAGGIIGHATTNINTIENITIKSDISSTGSSGPAGGVIGEAYRDIDTIENITVEGDISSTSSPAGGIIGHATTNINTIENITIKSDISSTGSSGPAGGVIGEAYRDIDTIENILIEGNVSRGRNLGGLIGYIGNDEVVTIKDITIKSNISGTDSTSSSAGGIVGYASTNINTIENILIEGNVSESEKSGGLIGQINNGEVETIKAITIKGDISSTGNYNLAGGIIGQSHIDDIDTIENILIENIIKGESAGGLVGGGSSQLSNIYDVKIINSEINGIKNSGGLFGSLYSRTLIEKVLIKDTIIKSDSSHSGGLAGEIVGLTASDITIENSNITGSLSTGGIAGVMSGNHSLSGINIDKKTTINGFGDGGQGTGGIIGKVNSSTTPISDINISADITGIDNVGELYGYIHSQGKDITENYNFDGTLSGTGDNVGGSYGYIYITE